MPNETNAMKVDSEKIKNVLRHHHELTRQIHNHLLDIRKKIDEVEQQAIEMASYPKIDLSIEGRGSGEHKDLADVYLKYQKLVRTQERELTDEIIALTVNAEGIHRLYLCFQSLTGEEYNIINRIYVKGELYKSVEKDSGLNHRVFEERRKQAILDIQQLYESDLSNKQIVNLRKDNTFSREKKEKGKKEYQQISLADIDWNFECIGDGGKDGVIK